jgi:hypothetical protein
MLLALHPVLQIANSGKLHLIDQIDLASRWVVLSFLTVYLYFFCSPALQLFRHFVCFVPLTMNFSFLKFGVWEGFRDCFLLLFRECDLFMDWVYRVGGDALWVTRYRKRGKPHSTYGV